MKTKSYKKYKANQNHNNNRRITMNKNDSNDTMESTSEYFYNHAVGVLKCLSIRATFVRGLLACDPAFCDDVENIIAEVCQTNDDPGRGVRCIPKERDWGLSQEQIAEIVGMKPDEFALFTPFLRRRLRGIGYDKSEILHMLAHYTWATPNFSLPPNLELPPDDVVLKTSRGDKKFRFDPFTQFYWDESVEDFRVAAMAPPLPRWKSPFASVTCWPRKFKVAKSIVQEIEGLMEQVADAVVVLGDVGMKADEIEDFIARFTWSGPKYGVRSGASKTKAQSVA